MFVSDLKREFYDVILGKVCKYLINRCIKVCYTPFLYLACPDIRQLRRGCNMFMSNSAVLTSL